MVYVAWLKLQLFCFSDCLYCICMYFIHFGLSGKVHVGVIDYKYTIILLAIIRIVLYYLYTVRKKVLV